VRTYARDEKGRFARTRPLDYRRYTPRDTVPVEPIREALARLGVPNKTLARRLGIDARSVRRLMGAPDWKVSPVTGERLGPYFQRGVLYDRAVLICDRAGIDYTEVGI